MERKEALLAAVNLALQEGSRIGETLGEEERNSPGTFERWSPKDGITHVAEWLVRDMATISSGNGKSEAITAETIEDINRSIFSQHSGKTWDEAVGFFRETYEDCLSLVAGMNAAELSREIERSDGSSRSVWRIIAGHALMHASAHFSMIRDRAGQPEKGTAFEEQAFRIVSTIDDSPEWAATAKYNLACRYAGTGEVDRAISLLTEVFAESNDLKEWAAKDEDLDPLRDEAGFRALMS